MNSSLAASLLEIIPSLSLILLSLRAYHVLFSNVLILHENISWLLLTESYKTSLP